MAEESGVPGHFTLTTTGHSVSLCRNYEILPCHLSPETSAVAMTIRWFRRSTCVYLYKNGQVTKVGGWEGLVSLNTQELQRGDVSLRLRDAMGWEGDGSFYICQVVHGGQKEEAAVALGYEGYPIAEWLRDESEEKKQEREESARLLDMKWDQQVEEMLRQLGVSGKMEEKDQQLKQKDKMLEENKTQLNDTTSKLDKTSTELKDLKQKNTQLLREKDQTKQQAERDKQLKERAEAVNTEKKQLAQHFVDFHRAELIKRVGEVTFNSILDELQVKGVSKEQCDYMASKSTTQEMMRALFRGPLNAGGRKLKDIVLAMLEKEEPFMIKDLEDLAGSPPGPAPR